MQSGDAVFAGQRKRVQEAFQARFGGQPATLIRAPGRVNLIGEHNDYNEGLVMPLAIAQSLVMAVRPRPDGAVRLYSLDFDARAEFDLSGFERGEDGLAEFVKGTAWALAQRGLAAQGWEGVFTSEIPVAAGLSSSAALEMASLRAFQAAAGATWDPVEMARLAQFAENEWVGVNCGIMDQLIVGVGEPGAAVLIDCRSLEHKVYPLPAGICIVATDSRVRRALRESGYNQRRQECEQAAAHFGLKSLRDLDLETLLAAEDDLPPAVFRRARHVLTENERVRQAADAMEANDAARLGEILLAGHASLRDDFAVSTPEIDVLVSLAAELPGCTGARLTGGGFGGCAVSLVAEPAVEEFIERLKAGYRAEIGLEAHCYVTGAEAGVQVFPIEG